MDSAANKSPFNVSSIQHRILGKQVRLILADNYVLRLTQAEASSLSFALIAVRDGVSPEREIYMSPIGSDFAFVGEVKDSGMSIAAGSDVVELDWDNVGKLAQALAAAIEMEESTATSYSVH
jgi:hypothetical protein